MEMHMKAAIYARFSTDKQTESSIRDQVRICTEYAALRGLEIVERFEDQGISGAAFGNRPGVQRALASLEAGMTLLVCDLSRLSRSQDLAPLLIRLTHRGIRVVGVQDGFDSDSPTARMQAGLSGIMSEEFRNMIKMRTHSALESRQRDRKPTGGKAYGYRDNAIDKGEAFMVLEIFGRFANGQSCRAIAAELNSRRIPSPGSSWLNRKTRRASGWMGSAIREMLRNERYRGVVRWNTSRWSKDPDTGKRQRRERPRSEWMEYQDESMRIVPDDLWFRAQRHVKAKAADKNWGMVRGKAKYLLSGLLRCESCGAHYVLVNAKEYGCSSWINGKACEAAGRVRRDAIEGLVVAPIRDELFASASLKRMEVALRASFQADARNRDARAVEAPREVQELEARIARLRARLRAGDPDMAPDEIQVAIERADTKLEELNAQRPADRETAKVLAMLPRAAEEICREISGALAGSSKATVRMRGVLRHMLINGRVDLKAEPDGSIWASYGLQTGKVLQAVGYGGSGGRI
jgi:site-specific DNA recombinase